jgi:hypothetical protein
MAKVYYSFLEQHILAARDGITSVIATDFALVAPPVDLSLMSQNVDEAFVLTMNMSLQRSRLQITFPDIGETANTPGIASLPPCGEGDVDNGIVASIVTPGLPKRGDVHGKGFNHRCNIVPALVRLEAVVSNLETGL